jgi:hypothetical protein
VRRKGVPDGTPSSELAARPVGRNPVFRRGLRRDRIWDGLVSGWREESCDGSQHLRCGPRGSSFDRHPVLSQEVKLLRTRKDLHPRVGSQHVGAG